MALATAASGTQTATINTEHSLSTQTTAAFYVLMVNVTNLANGDTLELRLKTKVLTGDTAEEIYYATYQHDQGAQAIIASPPVASMFSVEATLKQTAGTGRSFGWSLLSF